MELLSHAYRDSCSEDGDEPDADDQWEEVSAIRNLSTNVVEVMRKSDIHGGYVRCEVLVSVATKLVRSHSQPTS